jgi:hypothetical protein
MAPQVGLEPTTDRLTADSSTTELLRNNKLNIMVGLNGLEPSTSRLSGVRSNQLSYRPIIYGAGDGNRTHDNSLEGCSFTTKLHPHNYKCSLIPVVGVEPTLPKEHDFESCASANSATPAIRMEAATGFEPVVKVLQTSALPLGYAA